MPVPPLTAEQRTAALQKAAAARRTRAEVAAELHRSSEHLGTALAAVVARADADEAIAKMRVAALLDALPGIGKVRAAEIMERLAISPTRRVRGLGAKQRAALAAEFADD